MGKLTGVRPRVQALRPKLASAPTTRQERDKVRDQRPYRKWYKTAEWRALRMAVLLRDLFTCQRCGKIEGDTSQLVADHKRPHRGIAALFLDINNLWTLCKPCHDGWKQREEARDA